MKELLNKIVCQALDEVVKCADSKSLTDIRVKFLGKNGEMTFVMKGMGKLSPEERPAMGKLVNEAREKIENAIAEKDKKIKDEELALKLSAEAVDVTLPSKPTREVGSVHPLTRIKNEIIDIFKGFGFSVAEGPEIETDYFNFQLMNVPKDHPARDMQDTFYIDDNILLRTHTSPMQARIMTTQKPPIRVVVPGKVYRSDDDASHSPIFNQIEGLAVDKKITLGDLQGVLTAFGIASKVKIESYNAFLESAFNPVSVTLSNGNHIFIFALAHCGAMGTLNRNEKRHTGLEKQIRDWQRIKPYIEGKINAANFTT